MAYIGVLGIASPHSVASVTGSSVVASALAAEGLPVNRIFFPRTSRDRDAQFTRTCHSQAVPIPTGWMEIGSLVRHRRDAVIGKPQATLETVPWLAQGGGALLRNRRSSLREVYGP